MRFCFTAIASFIVFLTLINDPASMHLSLGDVISRHSDRERDKLSGHPNLYQQQAH